ncbi:MAG: TonB-dependent receptor [Gemmatimonadetes bacterium]|nr:TonB-dependent receptor [Gemmatimonadota bacterium]
MAQPEFVRIARAAWRSALAPIVLALSTGALSPAAAQQAGRIVGQVTEAGSGAPLGEVQIYLQGTGVGSLTNQSGRFVLLNVPPGTYQIRAERIGMATASRQVTVAAGQAAEVNFELETQALGLDEIVVTGTAGAARRREIGNTITQINVADIPDRPVDVTDVLQSSGPGIEVLPVGGEIGQGAAIRLRGASSVSMSNHPLIYIDGVRVVSEPLPTQGPPDRRGGRSANVTASPLDQINPNDIERIEIIKGSAATTLYGTEASAGVIQIFTKRGSAGAAVWTLETQQGTAWSRKFGPDTDHLAPTPPGWGHAQYNYMDPFLRHGWLGLGDGAWGTVHNQGYFASVRGGGQALQYFISGQFDDEVGLLPQDALEKWVARGNFTFAPVEGLQFQWNSAYANVWQKNTPSANNAQGLTLNAFRQERNYFGTGDPRALDSLLVQDMQQTIERVTTGGTVTYSPLSNLTNRLTIGYDYSQQEARQIRPFAFVQLPEGALFVHTYQKRILTFDYVGTYSFDLMAGVRSNFSWGGQAVGDDERQFEGYGTDFPGAVQPTVSSAAVKIAEESREKVWNAGFFFQNVFDVQNKYFVTAGMRVDGNSAFGEGFGLQAYPKVSVSWITSDEGFWPDSWGEMKLRVAYGKSGRAPGAFDAVRTWQSRGYLSAPAFVPENVGNPDLGPEVTSELESGFDAAWLNSRIRPSFTYYRKVTSEALFEVNQVPSQGFTNDQLLNVGEIRNAGIELGIEASVVQRRDWGLDLGLNVSTNKSEVVSLGGVPPFNSNGGWIEEGYPVYAMRTWLVTNPDEIAAPKFEANHIYGPRLPTRIIGGNAMLRLPAGISVSARGEYVGGHHISDGVYSISRSVRSPLCYPYYENPATSIKLKADATALWRARCTPQWGRGYVWDASFFKLRAVSATIPVDFVFPQRVSNATLTLALNNAYLWMKEMPFMDPEMLGNDGAVQASTGFSERVPTPITLRASLRITF